MWRQEPTGGAPSVQRAECTKCRKIIPAEMLRVIKEDYARRGQAIKIEKLKVAQANSRARRVRPVR